MYTKLVEQNRNIVEANKKTKKTKRIPATQEDTEGNEKIEVKQLERTSSQDPTNTFATKKASAPSIIKGFTGQATFVDRSSSVQQQQHIGALANSPTVATDFRASFRINGNNKTRISKELNLKTNLTMKVSFCNDLDLEDTFLGEQKNRSRIRRYRSKVLIDFQ